MKLLYFDMIATLVYALSMGYFVHEFRTVSPEERHERQTVPLLLTIRISRSFFRTSISRRYAIPVCLDKGCETDSVSKRLICSFNSISVIRFPIRHSAGHRRDAVPTTALLGMMFSLRFLV